MRLIDADALKYKNLAEVNGRLTYVLTAEEIDNAPTVEPTFGLFRSLFCETCQAYATNKAIAKLADEYTRPQGEWIENTDFEGEIYYECSVCKETWYVYDGAEMSGRMNYCPVCGADMRRREDGSQQHDNE